MENAVLATLMTSGATLEMQSTMYGDIAQGAVELSDLKTAPRAEPWHSFFPKASLRCLGSRLGVFREEQGLSGR